MIEERALLAEAETSASFPGEGIRLGCRKWEVYCSTINLHLNVRVWGAYRILVSEIHIAPASSKDGSNSKGNSVLRY